MTERQSKEHLETLKKLLTASLEEAKGDLSDQDYTDIKDYIDHSEYGVGWELLWHLVHAQRLPVPSALIECGRKMGFDISGVAL